MTASIGVNLRVTGHCSRGGRKYMEDFFSVAYQQSEDAKDLEYAFIGIYDGHGGSEAARFAREHLINLIVSQKLFWSDNDDDILQAIREGYIATHLAMWKEQEKWPKTSTGLPSTAGTTASVAFIRHGKIYIGHAGDSGIVLGFTEDDDKTWKSLPLTQDHKPESQAEKTRIINSGGKVITKYGVPRVVWNRPRLGHKGPVRRSTPIDEIPFLAVARSLGDLWSYNSALNEFVVSPNPDVRVLKINPKKFRCLIFGTDGLWNVISAKSSVEIVRDAEVLNDQNALNGESKDWTNPSKCLVDKALERWSTTRMRADNTSVVIIMLDPPGPPKRDVMKQYSSQIMVDHEQSIVNEPQSEPLFDDCNFTMFDHSTKEAINLDVVPVPTSGLAIMTRYETDNGRYLEEDKTEFNNYASTSSNTDISYMSSFAESYNSLLNANLENNYSAYTAPPYQQIEVECDDASDTYSLTRLETRTEQYQGSTYDESTSTSTLFSDYPQMQHTLQQVNGNFEDQRHQYDCITSSYLSTTPIVNESFSDLSNLEDSIQAAVSDEYVAEESYLEIEINETKVEEECLTEPITALDSDAPSEHESNPDESIQINEISSSSKENDEQNKISCRSCCSLRSSTRLDPKSSTTITQHPRNQVQTRSKNLSKIPKSVLDRKSKVISRVSSIRKGLSQQTNCKNKMIQNENIVGTASTSSSLSASPLPRTLRRTPINKSKSNCLDFNKRTLRSRNTIIAAQTIKPKFLKNKKVQNVNVLSSVAAAASSTVVANSQCSKTLREKIIVKANNLQQRPIVNNLKPKSSSVLSSSVVNKSSPILSKRLAAITTMPSSISTAIKDSSWSGRSKRRLLNKRLSR